MTDMLMIKNILERIDKLDNDLLDVKKVIASTEIDHQMFLRSNNAIPPGIACKVAYDKNGLVISGDKLEVSDIPELPIMKIKGLQKIFDEFRGNIDTIKAAPSSDEITKRNIEINGTGIKVNYDEHGHVVSTSGLTEDDIPTLSIEKIDGLKTQLDFLKSHHLEDNEDSSSSATNKINPGTATKVSYDSNGRITGGSSLTMDDIPIDMISRLNKMESLIPTLASSKIVENISMMVNGKVDSNNPISAGSYTKVKVDSKGLVTEGSNLTYKDIPELPISSITDLDRILRSKALQSDLQDISDTVSKLVSITGKISEITTIKELLGKKANDSDMKSTINRMDTIENLFTELQSKIPNELIMDQLDQIQRELSTLSGRISIIEKKISP